MQNLILSPIHPDELVKRTAEYTAQLLNESYSKKQKEEPELLTCKQVEELLHIDPSTRVAWTNKGKIKAVGIGNRRYYKRSELMEALTPLKK